MEAAHGRRALVLSGGSVKGAFQVGALAALLEHGWAPDAIYGVSVGSLNGAFLADRAGRMRRAGRSPDWPGIGKQLEDFWLERIDSFGRIGKRRSWLSLLWRLITCRFNGVTDMDRLRRLLEEEINLVNIRDSGLDYAAGYVDMTTGEFLTADLTAGDLHRYIMASTAIPVVMPYVTMPRVSGGEQILVDGGARDVTPLRAAIKQGATEIVTILCQPERLGEAPFDPGSLIGFAERLMDIIVNETVNNDINNARKWNEVLRQNPSALEDTAMARYREIGIDVIRPDRPLTIALESFRATDIQRLMVEGRRAAGEVVARL